MLKFYKEQLLYNENVKYGIALITEWRGHDKYDIFNTLTEENKNKIKTSGHLYSINGINYIIRNLFLNPHINHLVLIEDSSLMTNDICDSIKALISFIKNKEINFELNFELTKEDIDIFCEYYSNNITICKLSDLNDVINNIQINETDWTILKKFDDQEIDIDDTLENEKIGFVVRADKVHIAWSRIVDTINRYGTLKKSDYGEYQKEIINLSVIIRNENITDIYVPNYYPFNKQEIVNYIQFFLKSDKPNNVRYTYGNRILKYMNIDETIDQFEYMKQVLSKTIYSRRAVATLWNPIIDTKVDEVPCLNLIQAIVQNNTLYLTAYFRSNDFYEAWIKNVYGLLLLQTKLCEELDLAKGYINTIAGSAHIYERDFKLVLEDLKDRNISYCEEDDRGYFVIDVNNMDRLY